jgi:S-(hydroxymethyl)glutathione dehydrogenase/alcohol dehydrogenase
VYGIGDIGINAVQGAAYAGAKYVVAVDPVEFKRETALKFGATHAFASPEQAAEKIHELTWGQGADQALVTVGVVKEKVVQDAFDVVGKGGVVVVTGLGKPEELTVHVSGAVLTKWEKTIKGSMLGTVNPQHDIVKLLRLYDASKLKLDELATRHYRLEDINQRYADRCAGEVIRGVILHNP